jgi:polar amino acid transport system substrate-binding protein
VKRAVVASLIAASAAVVAACGSSSPSATTTPQQSSAPSVNATQLRPQGAQAVEVAAASTKADTSCHGRPTTSSLAPTGPLPPPGKMPAGSDAARIAGRGYLLAGVDQNTLLWGYLNPATRQLQGFDIDMVKQVAIAIFGDASPEHLHFVIVPNADRQTDVANGTVDLVAETMTITCGRQDGSDPPAVDFSSEYYDASQEILVTNGSPISSVDGLNGRRVCAAQGSTSLATVKAAAPQAQTWEAPNETDCLVMLQQGQVDAISTDDTILDGFVAQDPNLHILADQHGTPLRLSDEPYGMAISKLHPDLTRFVNAVLARERAGGTWAKIWTQDLKTPAPAPPVAVYRD